MLKKLAEAFVGAQTHDWQACTHYESVMPYNERQCVTL